MTNNYAQPCDSDRQKYWYLYLNAYSIHTSTLYTQTDVHISSKKVVLHNVCPVKCI